MLTDIATFVLKWLLKRKIQFVRLSLKKWHVFVVVFLNTQQKLSKKHYNHFTSVFLVSFTIHVHTAWVMDVLTNLCIHNTKLTLSPVELIRNMHFNYLSVSVVKLWVSVNSGQTL